MLPTRAFIYGHLYGNGIQQWINKEEGVKIQFKYTLYKPEINNYHQLNFSIQDLETGKHLKILPHLLPLQMTLCSHLII